jgi:hypothetical protein
VSAAQAGRRGASVTGKMAAMLSLWLCLAVVYVAGVTWGLIVIDAHPGVRIGLALAWPLGPLAFVVTVTILSGAAMIAFPAFGAALLASGAALWMVTQ